MNWIDIFMGGLLGLSAVVFLMSFLDYLEQKEKRRREKEFKDEMWRRDVESDLRRIKEKLNRL